MSEQAETVGLFRGRAKWKWHAPLHQERLPPWRRLARLCEAQGWRCAYCLCALRHPAETDGGAVPTRDHVRPICLGGPRRNFDNLVAACFACNHKKGRNDAMRYYGLPHLVHLRGLHARQHHVAEGRWRRRPEIIARRIA